MECLVIKTFNKVEQNLYKPGEQVEINKSKMHQKIVLEMTND
jgi:hypothetical protein